MLIKVNYNYKNKKIFFSTSYTSFILFELPAVLLSTECQYSNATIINYVSKVIYMQIRD
jgi:hypothetical protein